jgi:hypothetical protein
LPVFRNVETASHIEPVAARIPAPVAAKFMECWTPMPTVAAAAMASWFAARKRNDQP